jgi:hypothetical protein
MNIHIIDFNTNPGFTFQIIQNFDITFFFNLIFDMILKIKYQKSYKYIF